MCFPERRLRRSVVLDIFALARPRGDLNVRQTQNLVFCRRRLHELEKTKPCEMDSDADQQEFEITENQQRFSRSQNKVLANAQRTLEFRKLVRVKAVAMDKT